jgi:hypothetical protein
MELLRTFFMQLPDGLTGADVALRLELMGVGNEPWRNGWEKGLDFLWVMMIANCWLLVVWCF